MTRATFFANWAAASVGAALGVATIAKARSLSEPPKQPMPTGRDYHVAVSGNRFRGGSYGVVVER